MKQRRSDKPVIAPKTAARQTSQSRTRSLSEELLAIGRRCAALPELDPRAPDEILGYDENGLPT
jgi:antitoxin VapB